MIRFENQLILIGTKLKCPGCEMIPGIAIKQLVSGEIAEAEHFEWNPEYPKFTAGDVCKCRRCGVDFACNGGFYIESNSN